jgi:hypothetical protein
MEFLAGAIVLLLAAVSASAEPIAGTWNATELYHGAILPFQMEFSGAGKEVKGWFFNGDQTLPSTGGELRDGHLVLNFDQIDTKLDATLKDGHLDGVYTASPYLGGARWRPGHRTELDKALSLTPQFQTFQSSEICERLPGKAPAHRPAGYARIPRRRPIPRQEFPPGFLRCMTRA